MSLQLLPRLSSLHSKKSTLPASIPLVPYSWPCCHLAPASTRHNCSHKATRGTTQCCPGTADPTSVPVSVTSHSGCPPVPPLPPPMNPEVGAPLKFSYRPSDLRNSTPTKRKCSQIYSPDRFLQVPTGLHSGVAETAASCQHGQRPVTSSSTHFFVSLLSAKGSPIHAVPEQTWVQHIRSIVAE